MIIKTRRHGKEHFVNIAYNASSALNFEKPQESFGSN